MLSDNPGAKKQAAAKPRLLSGGNPQIPKADGNAPVQAYLAAMPGWKRAAGKRLDALIVRAVPGVRKAVRWNSPFYGMEGMGWFASYHCLTKYIKVTFLTGAALHPLPPVGSKQPEVRYVHIHEDDALDEAQLTAWFQQASQVQGDRLFQVNGRATTTSRMRADRASATLGTWLSFFCLCGTMNRGQTGRERTRYAFRNRSRARSRARSVAAGLRPRRAACSLGGRPSLLQRTSF